MKTLRLLAAGAIVTIGLGIHARSSSALLYSYTSGIQVQNLGTATATVVLTFYDSNGNATPVNDTIAANSSKTFFPLPGVSAGFDGAAIISSDQPVAAVANVIGSGASSARAAYVGALQGSSSVLLPLLLKNHGASRSNTWFKVQNTGNATANVTVNYSDATSANATIPVGASRLFDQSTETHNVSSFAGEVTSNQPVAVAVIQENTSTMFAYSGFSGGSTNPVMPLINANNNGYITGVQIQNGGNTDTQVTVSYTPAVAGTACTETQTIPAKQSRNFALSAFANGTSPGGSTNCIGGARFVGSAQVTGNSANQPLVVIVNQVQNGISGEAYNGFDPAAAKSKVVIPLIADRSGSSLNYTGFNIQNVGSSATTVTCTFSNTSYQVSATLQPGQALNDVQNGKISPGYVGSATCTASGGGKIVGVVNQVAATAPGDRLFVSEAIPVD